LRGCDVPENLQRTGSPAPSPGPDTWLQAPETVVTSKGVSVIMVPLKPATQKDVRKALDEVLKVPRDIPSYTPVKRRRSSFFPT